MKAITFVLTAIFLVFATQVFAQAGDMAALLKNVNLDKEQVSSMIDLLQQSGKISAEDAAKAKKELAAKSDSDMKLLKERAVQEIESGNYKNYNKMMPSDSGGAAAAANLAGSAPTTTTKSDSPETPSGGAASNDEKLQNALKFLNSQ